MTRPLTVLACLSLAACTSPSMPADAPAEMPAEAAAVPVVDTTGAAAILAPAVTPPAAAAAAFAAAHPAATGARWTAEGDDVEVAFSEAGTDMAIVYDAAGAERAVETKGALADLPAPVQAAVARDHAGQRLREAATIVEDGETTYEVLVDVDGTPTDVAYHADGTLVAD